MTNLILALLVSTGYAQTSEVTAEPAPTPETAPAPAPAPAKKIVVTGSYIKRIDEEGPSAVVTLKKEDLQKTGLNSVGDVLRDQAVISSVGREASGSSQAGASTASLRAFGSDSILVLLNGLRLPKLGGGNSVDLNLVPISALERVEILKDGASATYGSDAVGGVINFITKKDYNNTDATINYAMPEEAGGSRFDATISSGKSTEKWSVMGVLNFRKNEAIYDKDRYYSKMENIFTDGSIYASPGSWIDTTNPNVINTTEISPGVPCVQNQDGFCTFDFTQYSSGVPDLNQYSGMLSASYNFTESLKISTNQLYTRRDVFWRYAPAPDRIRFDQATAATFGLTPAPGGPIDYYYRLVEELGTRDNENITDSYTGQASIEGKFAPTWDWEMSGVYAISRTESTGTSGYARKDVLQQLAANGDFNPNLPSGAKSDLSSAQVNPFQEIRNTHYGARFITSAPIYDGGDNFGPIAFAAGLSADWAGYFENVDPVSAARGNDNLSLLFGGSGSMGQGNRNFQAAFTEFSFFPKDDIEIQLAGRYDRFSDFGNTFNPKLSLSWQATPKVMFRTSFGTGFRAPNLDSLYAGDQFGNPTFVDVTGCATNSSLCYGRQYQFRTRGNSNLDEETSIFYNAGFVLQPKKNWNITVDAWGAAIRDQVGISLTDATFVESLVNAQGGNGRQYMIDKYGITINRLGNGRIDFVDGVAINNGTRRVAGVDVGINTQKDARLFTLPVSLVFGMEHTQFFKSSSTTFDEIGPRKNSDIFWKNNLNAAVRYRDKTFRLAMNTVPGGDKALNSANFVQQEVGYGSVPFYTQYDFTFVYANIWKGDLTLGVRNLFDAKRPYDDTFPVPTRMNLDLLDPSGRTYQFGYNMRF